MVVFCLSRKKLYISQPAVLNNDHSVKQNGHNCIVHIWEEVLCVPLIGAVLALCFYFSVPGSNCQCAEPLNEQQGGISLVI